MQQIRRVQALQALSAEVEAWRAIAQANALAGFESTHINEKTETWQFVVMLDSRI